MNDTAEQIRQLLLKAGKNVSTAESITAGHLQAMLSSVSGASDVFMGGITAYKLPVKVQVLGVDRALAAKTDCVNLEVAEQMALGALKLFQSDYALSSCGYAELKNEKPYAFMAIADAKGSILSSQRLELSGKRVEAQKQAAQLVLEKFEKLLRQEDS